MLSSVSLFAISQKKIGCCIWPTTQRPVFNHMTEVEKFVSFDSHDAWSHVSGCAIINYMDRTIVALYQFFNKSLGKCKFLVKIIVYIK